jgi:predicted ATPase
MMDSDPFETQRDAGSAVVTELRAAGFGDAIEIGSGGFGIVFRCTQVGLDRTVAVKVLTAELDANRDRFLREQRAMGRLTGHPNIVGVLQVGETECGHPYLVMQYHRRGSLEARIKRSGALPLEDVLRLGVKTAGALETAHRLGILHRDVKPANILFTDYGEPALSDFGIAHIAGGFTTATGVFTGSPAFTAPEILSGDPPSRASDVYALGSTLFAAVTGHAAFERRSGEQLVAQFLRIASESAPDLRETGIPDDIATVIDAAMARDPQQRPSAADLGEELQRLQSRRNLPVDEMALRTPRLANRPDASPVTPRPAHSNLPLELTSFVGRRTELSAIQQMLSSSRLVTLTGIGGVGKTRLATRAGAEARPDFPEGVWLVELGELRDESSVIDVVAAALGLRDDSARSLHERIIEFFDERRVLLVLDNCEHVVDAAAKLAESLLRGCADLRIFATSREALGIGGEAVLSLSPLAVPSDAVALFAERAAAVVPGFELTDENTATVNRICSRLEGLPLAIELAAAQLKAMSLDQILERLADRYKLLTHGSRLAPARQQTLAWSVGWSYDLCTPAQKQLWARLSVFAGSFELEAAEGICNGDLAPENVDDLLFSLVDKSVLIRTQLNGTVRFRLLETLRDFGRERLRESAEYEMLRRRHLHWYRRLAENALAEWCSPRQVYWIERVDREMANVREALEFGLADSAEAALGLAASLSPLWIARGMLSEGRRWLHRALATTRPEPTMDRMWAFYGCVLMAGAQNDVPIDTTLVADARTLAEQVKDPVGQGLFDIIDGFAALVGGDLDHAYDRFENAVGASDEPIVRIQAMLLLGWALEFAGDIGRALLWQEKALAIAESAGESMYRSSVLWALGVGWWRHGDSERAEQLLVDCLRLAQQANHPFLNTAQCFEVLAWVARANDDCRRAAILMAAADKLGRRVGSATTLLPHLNVFHEECACGIRETLDTEEFDVLNHEGAAMSFDEAIDYALRANT